MKVSKLKKIGLIGVLLTISSMAFAAQSDWQDLKGCYSTITYNGQPGSTKPGERGNADYKDNFAWATMPGADHIGVFNFMLFKYRQGNTQYYDFAWIFPDYGTTSISSDGRTRTWAFNGPMICTGLCKSPTPFTMNTKVEITDLGNDTFQVHNFREIPEVPDQSMNADDIYVVKRERQNCWMCEQNPDGSYSCGEQP